MKTNSTENLEKAQENQKRVGAAESDQETTSPTDKLREDAASVRNIGNEYEL